MPFYSRFGKTHFSLSAPPSRLLRPFATVFILFAFLLYFTRNFSRSFESPISIHNLNLPSWSPPSEPYDAEHFDDSNGLWLQFEGVGDQFALSTPRPQESRRNALQSLFKNTNLSHGGIPPVPCRGPRGNRLNHELDADTIFQNQRRPSSFPEPLLGSNRELGFQEDICYERHGRWRAYGLDNKDVHWEQTDWASLQNECVEANKDRFNFMPRATLNDTERSQSGWNTTDVPRTAIVFRVHQDFQYTSDNLRNLRAVTQELALESGGQYQAFLLVEVKDPNVPIETPADQDSAIREFVPTEFHHMAVLWREQWWDHDYALLKQAIPEGQLSVHFSQWLPLQWFQRQYPWFDYFWNWEVDVRYTGHYLEMVRNVEQWTADQPRKGLWERNSRFFIPSYHESWDRFRESVQERYTTWTGDNSIWGPQLDTYNSTREQQSWLKSLQNVTPPVSNPVKDHFSWGVNEPADLIMFLPQFNPAQTHYVHEGFWFNYPHGIDRPHDSSIARRATIITFGRVSARLLRLMELENTTPPGHHMQSELWPHTVALHYGLKSVSVPHGIFFERDWPVQAANWVFNNGDQKEILKGPERPFMDSLNPSGEGSGGPESTFSSQRGGEWMASSWYYQNDLAKRLYRRWLGWEDGGVGGRQWEEQMGLFCLPPMLLHPVKAMEDPEDSGFGAMA